MTISFSCLTGRWMRLIDMIIITFGVHLCLACFVYHTDNSYDLCYNYGCAMSQTAIIYATLGYMIGGITYTFANCYYINRRPTSDHPV